MGWLVYALLAAKLLHPWPRPWGSKSSKVVKVILTAFRFIRSSRFPVAWDVAGANPDAILAANAKLSTRTFAP